MGSNLDGILKNQVLLPLPFLLSPPSPNNSFQTLLGSTGVHAEVIRSNQGRAVLGCGLSSLNREHSHWFRAGTPYMRRVDLSVILLEKQTTHSHSSLITSLFF